MDCAIAALAQSSERSIPWENGSHQPVRETHEWKKRQDEQDGQDKESWSVEG